LRCEAGFSDRGARRAGEIAPLPGDVLAVLVLGPVGEAARRWLAGTYDMDLGQAARMLPQRIRRSLAPDSPPAGRA